jgi:hypothetical protein
MAGHRRDKGTEMKHPTSRKLFDYWNKQRGNRLAPERSEIEPSEIRQLLGDTFVLAADGAASHPFRLAGTRLCALFTRELKTESFVRLWEKSGQNAVRELISVVMEEKVGVVAGVTGTTANDAMLSLDLELLLLPLSHHSPADARVLGAMAPMSVPYWLGAKAIGPLTLGMFRHIGPAADDAASRRLTPAPGRIRHGLTVYQGGRVN